MGKAIIGRKVGMTQIFADDGRVIPVTVIEAGPCPIVQVKTVETDGYTALKLGFLPAKEKALNKPDLGQFKKAGVSPCKVLKEVRVDSTEGYSVGDEVKADVFAAGDKVDASGVTKGHGYTGVIKRWNQHRLKETHGVGPVHREPGSMGANSTPSRVFKHKHLAGQYGVENVTIQNLEVVRVDVARNCILVKGAIPGVKGSVVTLKTSVKA
ncbi:MAG TPA: 50S ribosomal protein L3 [Candidatus Gallimonas intestinigallinarum]|uniref:Large ribosomal subunit protein uL3 n=1 Tax=Candidatus Gallimonas intestinigallinarum TaxID=2838604 RepID=A0A9D2DX81_9FIRM|nr:50S ribosomal protein L3 [Candidatus Gallimonas intestinigallinarum]